MSKYGRNVNFSAAIHHNSTGFFFVKIEHQVCDLHDPSRAKKDIISTREKNCVLGCYYI